jgi:hypothetical protein
MVVVISSGLALVLAQFDIGGELRVSALPSSRPYSSTCDLCDFAETG